MIIYLTGIDGAGKSTIGEFVKRRLEETAPCELIWARYQPRIMKAVVAPFRKKKVKSSSDYNNMTAAEYAAWRDSKKTILKEHPFLAKVLFLIQYVEYSWQIKGLFKGKTEKHLIIDRYVLDFIVDQTINYGDISHSFIVKRLLAKVAEFDKVLFVNVNSEVALQRKNDIPSLAYLDERRAIYLDYVKRLPNAVCIDNSGDIEDTKSGILKVLEL